MKKDGPSGWEAETVRRRVQGEGGAGGDATIAELVKKHGVHQTPISPWRRQAIEGMAGVFSGKAEAAAAERDGEVEKLHAKIGQLVVERDLLAKASGR